MRELTMVELDYVSGGELRNPLEDNDSKSLTDICGRFGKGWRGFVCGALVEMGFAAAVDEILKYQADDQKRWEAWMRDKFEN